MYKWHITYELVGGQTITGIYEGPENNSNDVANRILIGGENDFFGLHGSYNTSNLLVRNRDVSAVDIREWKG